MGYSIYILRNKINDKIYVGQTTVTLHERLQNHFKKARHGGKTAIANAIRKYGEENFYIELYQECKSIEELNQAEINAIEKLGSLAPNGYNLKEGGSNGKPTQEVLDKMSKAMMGFKHSEETKEVLRKQRIGTTLSEETKSKISQSLKEYYANNEVSEEVRAKISKGLKGHKVSEETKRKIGEANRGREVSEETRKKLSEAGKGRTHSEETKEKIRQKAKEHWAKRKLQK